MVLGNWVGGHRQVSRLGILLTQVAPMSVARRRRVPVFTGRTRAVCIASERMVVPTRTRISETNGGMQIKTILNPIQKYRGFAPQSPAMCHVR
jgi:hypothetical protein